MAEIKGTTPAVNNNKLAMSRALGAAFLTHQVEQLEKTVSAGSGARNWRERRNTPDERLPSNGRGIINYGGKRSPEPVGAHIPRKSQPGASEKGRAAGEVRIKRRDEARREDRKDADVVVLDASVLIHALGQVKKWSRDGREEIIVVPLEGVCVSSTLCGHCIIMMEVMCCLLAAELRRSTYLRVMHDEPSTDGVNVASDATLHLSRAANPLNTLDLLKKGTSHLAQRARAASRILEAQVGTNPRIRVQRDDAFVLWDNITFQETHADDTGLSQHGMGSPEWVRRTICCARWEVENADAEVAKLKATGVNNATKNRRTVLAVLSPAILPHTSHNIKTAEIASESPVPLPVSHANKYEPRSSGALVNYWAKRAGIDIFEVKPASSTEAAPRTSEEERDRSKRGPVHHGGAGTHRGRKNSNSQPSGSERDKERAGGGGLVERPPAVKAMMEMVAQPSKVVRVLARGEKLDP
ncbi:hypothetical protein EW146_g7220 [Bondarzewia mesenterica]|uniref:PIN domain-containing protein n=1 Tax=Bondarzewia mesenterica TaxID=1095465 RepID=A0A4S4LLJ9_9AGAM|nr:hypothetical protein EW146_g7220 [Bondarzewia mesenterica]